MYFFNILMNFKRLDKFGNAHFEFFDIKDSKNDCTKHRKIVENLELKMNPEGFSPINGLRGFKAKISKGLNVQNMIGYNVFLTCCAKNYKFKMRDGNECSGWNITVKKCVVY